MASPKTISQIFDVEDVGITYGEKIALDDYSICSYQIKAYTDDFGTFEGTLLYQLSNDGVNWLNIGSSTPLQVALGISNNFTAALPIGSTDLNYAYMRLYIEVEVADGPKKFEIVTHLKDQIKIDSPKTISQIISVEEVGTVYAEKISLNNYYAGSFQATALILDAGTFEGALNLQASNDGVNWITFTSMDLTAIYNESGLTNASSIQNTDLIYAYLRMNITVTVADGPKKFQVVTNLKNNIIQ